MAEVLGTVVGVVSLGLQVCSGLSVYIDGLQCRREEIESTIRHQKSLETLVAQIEALYNRRQTPDICSASLQESMASAKAELLLLDEFISKVRIEDVTGTDRSVGNMMKIQKKRLLYPFRRDRLDRLVTRLDVVIKALQAALQVFELEASLETKCSLDQVLQTVSSSNVSMLGIEKKIDENASLASLEIKNSFEQVFQTVSRSELNMLSIERKIDEKASLARLPDYATKEDVMELKTLMAGLMSSSATGTLKNLVSKPSALKAICDNMSNLETMSRADGSSLVSSETVTTEPVCQEADMRSQFRCTCNPRRVLRRQKRSFGAVYFAKEAVTERVHVVGCPFALFNIHETNSWSAGITFSAFRRVVSTAVNVSLSITAGAGGFGMSPSFTCFHMRESSPAFQVVDVLLRASNLSRHKLTDEDVTKVFERGMYTLKTVLTSRTSSPFETDINGNTLLHAASDPSMDWVIHRHELIEFLLAVGVPKDRPNQNDEYAFQKAQTGWYLDHLGDLRAVQTLDALMPHDVTFASELSRSRIPVMGLLQFEIMRFHQTWTKNSINATQIYCNHPLEAMLFRNKSRLLEALDRQVSLNLSEADAFGFSSLYHLIGWPEGLRIVLRRYGKSILHSHDRGVVGSALECALQWSSAICSGSTDGRCLETCLCAESVSILLQTDNECLARTVRRESLTYAIRGASVRARGMFIDGLAKRRQELKTLGLRHLNPTEIDCFGLLGNNVLDRHTGDVLKALDDKGICVHPSLRTEVVGDESCASGSVYHHGEIGFGMAFGVPNAFYCRGFTEVDVPNAQGLVPLALRTTPEYREWLVEQGANLTTKIPGRPSGFTTAHMLLWPRANIHFSSLSLDYTSGLIKSLGSHIPKSASLDACRCGCSKDGCHPYAVMWRVALRDWSVDQITQASLKHTGGILIELCEDLETYWALSREEISIFLRVCTFMALPIRHTCCCFWEHKKPSPSWPFEWIVTICEEDEVEEIQEEDTHQLAVLEDLLVEFESKIDEMGFTLAMFFETYWLDRMGQVLQEIKERPLLEEEVQGAERLGITLRVEEENRQEDDSQLEYWFRKLDAIVA